MSLLQRLSDMAVFARVVECRSFTQAGLALDMSKGAVSKAISRLEQHLKVRLLQRSTRQLSLTAEGQAFFAYCQQVVQQADHAEHHLSELRDEPTGLIRLSSPVTFGTMVLAPLFADLHRQYPLLQIELNLDDNLVDLIADQFDLAVRFGKLADSSLIARALPGLPIVLVASPGYLQQHGTPAHPNELVQHSCLTFGSLAERTWRFEHQGGAIDVLVDGPLRCNSNRAMLHAALADLGILFVSRYQVEQELASGALLELLPDFMPKPPPFHLVYPHRQHMKAGLKVVIQYLLHQLNPALAAVRAM